MEDELPRNAGAESAHRRSRGAGAQTRHRDGQAEVVDLELAAQPGPDGTREAGVVHRPVPAREIRPVVVEVLGDEVAFAAALEQLGCECALAGGKRIKAVVSDAFEIRDIYRLADQHHL